MRALQPCPCATRCPNHIQRSNTWFPSPRSHAPHAGLVPTPAACHTQRHASPHPAKTPQPLPWRGAEALPARSAHAQRPAHLCARPCQALASTGRCQPAYHGARWHPPQPAGRQGGRQAERLVVGASDAERPACSDQGSKASRPHQHTTRHCSKPLMPTQVVYVHKVMRCTVVLQEKERSSSPHAPYDDRGAQQPRPREAKEAGTTMAPLLLPCKSCRAGCWPPAQGRISRLLCIDAL